MTATDAIFFDLDGTLLTLSKEYPEIVAETFTAVEGTVQEEWVDQYNEAFFELFGAHEPDPIERAFASIEGCSNANRLTEELRSREANASQVPTDAHEDLTRLGDHFALGVLTNGLPGWQRYKLQEHELDQYFDTVVTSYEAGAHKPDPAPYRLAEERLSAQRYAMIGDDSTDVEGAENVAWTGYRYRGSGFRDVPECLDWS